MPPKKIRFLEPSNAPYRKSLKNHFVYDRYLRNPSHGMLLLTTLVKEHIPDTLMYSESISVINWEDILDADIVFIGVFTFSAPRGYELAQYIKKHSQATVVMGGLHASLHYEEAVRYCDYVLLGEGEESILEFIKAKEQGLPIDFPGVAYLDKEQSLIHTGKRTPPQNTDPSPDRNLLYNYHKMAGHNTLWPQVHASRGCPHNCDYCAVIKHFGRCVRTRSPKVVVEEIKQAIDFFENRKWKRLNHALWLTDDNFFANRDWAIAVLKEIIDQGIQYKFTIQARFEVGLDDEMLVLLKQAGFLELALGIEFLEDEAFELYHKQCSYQDVVRSIQNIQAHGLNARGLFIVGADNHSHGIGQKLADFVISHNIKGMLIQSMYFIPGTPAYEANKDRLLHQDWEKYTGHVVHSPKMISPYDLQLEIITAIYKVYSVKRLMRALFKEKGQDKVLFAGEFYWQRGIAKNLKRELKNLPRS